MVSTLRGDSMKQKELKPHEQSLYDQWRIIRWAIIKTQNQRFESMLSEVPKCIFFNINTGRGSFIEMTPYEIWNASRELMELNSRYSKLYKVWR
jgi:hypothetical protein